MISEGETKQSRRVAGILGESLNADYCSFEFDENENVTLVLKYGDFDAGSDTEAILQHIRGGE